MNCIIYCRKSTDREDKQAISLEHQIENCRRSVARHQLEIVQEIQESKSAKKKWLRPGFKAMIQKCEKWKIDYIVVDELKRLSRNTSDWGDIINLLDEQKIKGIITTGKLYDSESHNDTMMLSFEFIFSKKENQDRARDTKVKMTTTVKNHGRHLSKAPFGYKNVTISKSEKTVILDWINAEFVKEMFELRKAGMTLQAISKHGETKWIRKLKSAHIEKILKNKFYYGILTWGGENYPGNHVPLITKELFDSVNVMKRVQECRENDYLFQRMIHDSKGLALSPYIKKGKYIYYHNQSQSLQKINMSEKKILEKIDFHILFSSIFVQPWMIEHFEDALTRLQTKFDEEQKNERRLLLEDKKELDVLYSALVDSFLLKKIDSDTYNTKLWEYKTKIKGLELKIEKSSDDSLEIHKKVKKICELTKSACISYKTANDEQKIEILKMLECELIAKDSETLLVKQKRIIFIARGLAMTLYGLSALQKDPSGNAGILSVYPFLGENFFGDATESWTPLYGMKTRCPNR